MPKRVKKRFFGSVNINPIRAKTQFNEVAEEVVRLFTDQPMAKVEVTIEINVESGEGELQHAAVQVGGV